MTTKDKNPAAMLLGSLGGKKRAANNSPAKLSAIAKRAAAARWKDHVKPLKRIRRKKPPL